MSVQRKNGRFVPGQSGNPKGRPKNAFTLTRAIRDTVDPELIAQVLYAIALGHQRTVIDTESGQVVYGINHSPDVKEQLAAINILAERGFIKPDAKAEAEWIEAEVARQAQLDIPVGDLSLETLRRMERELVGEDLTEIKKLVGGDKGEE